MASLGLGLSGHLCLVETHESTDAWAQRKVLEELSESGRNGQMLFQIGTVLKAHYCFSLVMTLWRQDIGYIRVWETQLSKPQGSSMDKHGLLINSYAFSTFWFTNDYSPFSCLPTFIQLWIQEKCHFLKSITLRILAHKTIRNRRGHLLLYIHFSVHNQFSSEI